MYIEDYLIHKNILIKGVCNNLETERTREIYSSMNEVWPHNNAWYTYLHNKIVNYVEKMLSPYMSENSVFLNAGSGGSIYNLKGTCYHVDIVANLIQNLSNAYVASVEKLPFKNDTFDSIICVGSVINYCSAFESIMEFSRTIRKNGILIIEFERSQSAELWFSKDFNKQATLQHYNYLNNIHTLWLYSENYVCKVLKEAGFKILNKKRLHTLSAIINRYTHNEIFAGEFGKYDFFLSPLSYLAAHNIIITCKKL